MCSDASASGGPARILDGYGSGGFAITTGVPAAQRFFDNGLQLAHAFAHSAAVAAFAEARRLDPQCAMCVWGEAWASGPTLNYGIEPADRDRLAALVATAAGLSAEGTAKEKALIAALGLRYADAEGNSAFAAEMDRLAGTYPEDDALAVLAADALMITATGPAEVTRPLELLEQVLARQPDYTPAMHFHIHASEWAGDPGRSTPYANRLATLAPAASHLVHMPAHTFFWTGRYAEAAASNVRAVEISDEDAREQGLAEADGRWTIPYYGHNVVYGLAGAMLAGDSEAGLRLARPVLAMAARTAKLDDRQGIVGRAYIAAAQFAPLSEVLAVPDPGSDNPLARMLWRYARGEAFARAGDTAALRRELRAMPRKMDLSRSGGASQYLLEVSRLVLQGRLAMLRSDPRRAVTAFRKAASIEESGPLDFSKDPPAWWYPIRRDVAAAMLAAGDAAGARQAAQAALQRRPNDPASIALVERADRLIGGA